MTFTLVFHGVAATCRSLMLRKRPLYIIPRSPVGDQSLQTTTTTMNTSTPNMIGSRALEDLPEEIRLEVLLYAFDFPNGVHSDRYLNLKQARIDKFLGMRAFARLVPEALYKHNKLVIQEGRFRTSESMALSRYRFEFEYPGKTAARWVRSMELQISMFWSDQASSAELHYPWLNKLANQELGFDRLEKFKISIVVGSNWATNGAQGSTEPLNLLRDMERLSLREKPFGHIKFACRELKLEVLGHTCSSACVLNPGPRCDSREKLNQLFSATGSRPLDMI